MQFSRLTSVFFSPTGATRRVLQAIAEGLGIQAVQTMDITHNAAEAPAEAFAREGLALLGAPVYKGRIPAQVYERLQGLQAGGTAAVLVVTYGNRAIDDALLELADFSRELGFTPFAAAAFIGEHSFSTPGMPIAAGRPDARDLELGREFGRRVGELAASTASVGELPTPEFPGNHPYRETPQAPAIAPATDPELCQLCGECVAVCPVDAIELSDAVAETDAEVCIWCCACVKACPEQARQMRAQPVEKVRNWLYENFTPRQEPRFFGV